MESPWNRIVLPFEITDLLPEDCLVLTLLHPVIIRAAEPNVAADTVLIKSRLVVSVFFCIIFLQFKSVIKSLKKVVTVHGALVKRS